MHQGNDTVHNGKYIYALLFPICALIYFVNYKWHTFTIYGDDLLIYNYYGEPDITKHLSISTTLQKYRPVSDLVVRMILSLFGKHLFKYYLFNVLMQGICCVLFIRICDHFLRSIALSCLAGLTIALSRFNLFNLTQLYNGGALETLAMVFFLPSLLHIVRSHHLVKENPGNTFKALCMAWLFATLAAYTHERYIVLFPFIILCTLVPRYKPMRLQQRSVIIALSIISVIINYSIKKYNFHLNFFTGTGNTLISFSLPDAAGYLKDAVLSIAQINSGPEFLIGTPFLSLFGFIKVIAVLSPAFTIAILITYVVRSGNADIRPSGAFRESNSFLLLLFALFALCLLPAIVTIRLEQRWLQASLCIYILIIVIAVNNTPFKKKRTKAIIISVYILLFSGIGLHYQFTGTSDIYLCVAHSKARLFEQAIKNGTIRRDTDTIYIYEAHKNQNDENEYSWILGKGYFFYYYGQNLKKIAFVDSTDQSNDQNTRPSPIPDKSQVVYIGNNIMDITKEYMDHNFRIPNP